MDYIDQSHKDLVYNFTEGYNEPQSPSLTEGEMILGKGLLKLSIIGGSHYLLFNPWVIHQDSDNEFTITEVVACCPLVMDTTVSKRVGDMLSVEDICKKLTHKFENEYLIYNFELCLLGTNVGLIQGSRGHEMIELVKRFPAEDGGPMSKTQIKASKIDENKVNIVTLHEYPNENVNVVTQTYIEVK